MPRRSWSIRWWLASLVVVIALPLAAWLTVEFFALEWREPREAQDAALRVARSVAMRLRALHVESLALLDGMAARPEIANFDGQRCDSLFAMIDFFPQYDNLVLLDTSGRVVCSATSAGLPWIREELIAGRLQPRRPVLREAGERWMSAIARPVEGRFRGTLVLIALPEMISYETLLAASVITVFDDRGTLIARTGESSRWVGRDVRGSELLTAVRREKEGVIETRGVDGVTRQYGFATVEEMGWAVAVGVSTAETLAPARAELLRGIGGAVMIFVILIAVVALMSRSIGRPIDALARVAAAVSHGGYGKVDVEGPREVAALAEAFNEMVDRRQENEQQLKAISERLIVVQEEERTRIARELHDDLGQALTALKMDVIGMMHQTAFTSPEGAAIRNRVLRTLDTTVQSVQRISAELRPSMLDDLGLAEALESDARAFEERTGIECDVSLPHETSSLGSGVATAVYRIVQEALTNVARHSDATRVELRMRILDAVLLVEIRDDGRGITAQEVASTRSLGLIGIRERAALIGGIVRVVGITGQGTVLSVRIPMPES